MWIEALRQATPHSPNPGRKDPPINIAPKVKEEERPKYTQRQETVDKAAVVASEAATTNGHIEEVKYQNSSVALQYVNTKPREIIPL